MPGQNGFQCVEPAIETRLDGGDWCGGDDGDFVELHLLLKSENEDFTIHGANFPQRLLDDGALLGLQEGFERRLAAVVWNVEVLWLAIATTTEERVNALRFLAAVPVEDQIAGDGKKPSFKFPSAVVLVAAFENAEPGFLEEIFSAFAVGGEVDQITEQAELVLLDEEIEEFGIAAFEALGQGFGVVEHEGRKA